MYRMYYAHLGMEMDGWDVIIHVGQGSATEHSVPIMSLQSISPHINELTCLLKIKVLSRCFVELYLTILIFDEQQNYNRRQ